MNEDTKPVWQLARELLLLLIVGIGCGGIAYAWYQQLEQRAILMNAYWLAYRAYVGEFPRYFSVSSGVTRDILQLNNYLYQIERTIESTPDPFMHKVRVSVYYIPRRAYHFSLSGLVELK